MIFFGAITIVFAVHLLTGCVLLVLTIVYREHLLSSGSEMIDKGNFATFVALILLVLSSMLISFFFRHKVWRMVLELECIDRALKANGLDGIDSRIERTALAATVFTLCFTVPILILIYMIEGSLLKICVYSYAGTYYMLCISAVVAFTNGGFALYRLRAITKACKNILDSSRRNQTKQRIGRDI